MDGEGEGLDVLVQLRRNKRAESSHVPIRRREREMQRFKTQASAQRFLSTFGPIYNLFNVQRHLISRRTLRIFRNNAMKEWEAALPLGLPLHSLNLT